MTNKCSIITHTNLPAIHQTVVTETKYSLQLINADELFLKSIYNSSALIGATISNTYKSIQFYASSVKTLQTFIEDTINSKNSKNNKQKDEYEEEIEPYILYEESIHIISGLTKQQLFLEKNGYGFYNIHMNDIIVVDDLWFICINPNFIQKIEYVEPNKKGGNFHFYYPFIRNEYSSPELCEISGLPAKVSSKTVYYSFGALIMRCLFVNNTNKTITKTKENTHTGQIKQLQSIINTKLYWFLVRCLSDNIETRDLCLI